jgi:hypothetical protein
MDTPNGSEAREVDLDDVRYEEAHDLLERWERAGVYFWTVGEEVRFRPASLISEEGKAELKSYEDEVYALLREEEEVEARNAALFAAQPEADPLPEDEYEEFSELSCAQGDALFAWISETFEAAPELERYRHDSYELKHIFERAPEGFYVTDGQFRAAMWIGGHLGRYYPGRAYADCESRFYYLRPNREGFIEKLARVGVPTHWARDAIIGADEGRQRKEL